MLAYIDKIKEISAQLLKDCTVDMVIGFRKGSLAMMNEPFFAKTPAEVDEMVWDGNCGINLANYITGRKEKIGIIAKGCDSRNIVTHIIENKIDRDQLHIIGVPCKGMIDKSRIETSFGTLVDSVVESGDTLTVTGGGKEETYSRQDMLQQNCSVCNHRNPVIYDDLAADQVDEQDVDRYADVREIEALSPDEKRQYFDDLLATCIRCYACRNACPLCYCPTCFVDESRPQWVGKTLDPIDTRTFHFLRAFHCAGRCTDCGSCERACPMNINVRAFTKKLEKDAFEMYGWEAGLTVEERPPLDTFKTDDPEDFIK